MADNSAANASSGVLEPLVVNTRTLAGLGDPTAVRRAENFTPLTCSIFCTIQTSECPGQTKYPLCDDSSYSGCLCGC